MAEIPDIYLWAAVQKLHQPTVQDLDLGSWARMSAKWNADTCDEVRAAYIKRYGVPVYDQQVTTTMRDRGSILQGAVNHARSCTQDLRNFLKTAAVDDREFVSELLGEWKHILAEKEGLFSR